MANIFQVAGTIFIDNAKANISIDDTTKKAKVAAGGVEELGTESEKAESKLGKAFKKVGEAAVAVGKVVATGLAVGATAMAGLTVKALNLGGELEQNLGGLGQVFDKENFPKTFEQMETAAKNAFSNMGLSTSDYMATANKMGALFQGSNFTIQESADMSEKAMQRAADVASIMGIDVTSAMDAVAGAAKGNFTMMDNLGVAMNDTAIKAYALENGLIKSGEGSVKNQQAVVNLEKAQKKLNEVTEKHGKDSLEARDASAKLAKAQEELEKSLEGSTSEMTQQEKIGIAMQMFLDKTSYAAGNYAKENETLAGALGTTKAALTNFLDGSGDVDGLINSLENFANVILGQLDELLPRLTNGITQLVEKIVPKLPPILEKMLPTLISTATNIINGIVKVLPTIITAITNALPTLISGFIQIMTTLVNSLPQIITPIIQALPTLIPQIVNGIIQMFLAMLSNVMPIIQPIIDALPEIIISIIGALMDNLPQLIEGLIQLVIALVQAIPKIIFAIIQALPTIIDMVIKGLLNALPQLITGLIQLVFEIVLALPQIIAGLIAAIPTVIISIVASLLSVGYKIIEALTGIFSGGWDGVKKVFNGVKDFFGNAFGGAVDRIKQVFGGIGGFFKGTFDAIVGIVKAPINFIIDGINMFLGFLNKIKIPDWVPGVGGLGFNFNMIKKLRIGLEYVPYDDMPALLHKGERVLTASEAKEYDSILNNLKKTDGETVEPLTFEINIENFINNRAQDVRELVDEIMEIAEEKRRRKQGVFA